jgi:cation diffusion facilitator family transporter
MNLKHDAPTPQSSQATTAQRKSSAAFWSIIASVVITIGKGLAGFATGSLALISDAAHSLFDVVATTITYLAIKAADKPADEEHPFGHGKVESVAALAETAFLFVLSGAVAYEGIRRLLAGVADFTPSWIAAGVLVVAIAVDAWRWISLKRVARETGSEALEADALHFSADLINSALVLMAFGAAALGYPQADALVAIAVAVFIAIAGFRLARRTLDTLIDTAPKGSSELLRRIVSDVPGVVDVQSVRLRLSGGRLIGEVNIQVSRTLALERVAELKDEISRIITATFPDADITIVAQPIALDSETLLERVLLIAIHNHVPAHHVTVQNISERLSVSADLEIDGRMSLGDAHRIASNFEAAIRAEFGAATEVETHIEPLEVSHLEGHEADARLVAKVATALAEHAAKNGIISHVHNVRVRRTSAGLVVNYHCWADPDLDVANAHAAVDAVERRMRADMPDIRRIVGHAEPSTPEK